ncbi:DUF6036 family nucleotidyltransferase [Nocardioides sp. zg-DK7169]|uniref:DUF6036 family nucleotidyltransferase n=1 Tax=Nocardioides sp. zg-DK7169 TaxID=2736600 RepID=UPI001C12F118|nr:DUF6036 family nucleotidyltransferase [Nocardioides sp. zg-DK7169]
MDDPDVLVLGSQSILGTFDEDDLPAEATASLEADVAFLNDPDRDKADRVEGTIGELSPFHDTNGYYAEGIHVSTAVLPRGWRDRLVGWGLVSSAPARPHFLDPHDLAVSKMVRLSEKDRLFVGALIEARMLDVQRLRERAEMLDEKYEKHRIRIHGYLDFYDRGAGRPGVE